MGCYFTRNMEENFIRNQKFITDITNRKIERKLQIQNELREKEMALQIATNRELFTWYAGFYLCSISIAIARSHKYKTLILPIMLPLTFILGYYGDLAYGNKLIRIKSEADNILIYEKKVINLPSLTCKDNITCTEEVSLHCYNME